MRHQEEGFVRFRLTPLADMEVHLTKIDNSSTYFDIGVIVTLKK